MRERMPGVGASSLAASSRVETSPGITAQARTPFAPSSMFSVWQKAETACFEAL